MRYRFLPLGSIPEYAINSMSDRNIAPEGPRVEPVWDPSQPGRDKMRPRGTSGALRGISGGDWLLYAAVAAVALGIGVVNALSIAQDAAWRGGVYDIRAPLFREMSSVGVIVLVAPILFVAVRRVRRASGWLRRLALATAAIVAFSTLHIAGTASLRKMATYLVGGSYDFRFSAAALIYEFRKDLITCLMIGGSLWLTDSRRETRHLLLVATAFRRIIRLTPHIRSGFAMAQPVSASNRATFSGSARPGITSNIVWRMDVATSSGEH